MKAKPQEFKQEIVRISTLGRDRLEVNLVSATEMNFQVDFQGMDYEEAVRDVCRVAPALLRVDSDAMEAADDAGRTKVDAEAAMMVRAFRRKYHRRVIDPLDTLGSMVFY